MKIVEYLELIKSLRVQFDWAEKQLGLSMNSPGYALSVIHNQHIAYERFVGLSSLKTKKVIDSDSMFLLSSMSKPMLANIFLENIHSLKSSQAQHYLPTSTQDLTIAHLLKHQSGLQDYVTLLTQKEINHCQLDDLVTKILSWKLNFQPGMSTSFSHSGYVVLTKILELLSQKDHAQAFNDFYQKKGLQIAYGYKKSFVANYEFNNDAAKRVVLNRYVTGWGDGYAYASVSDYGKIFSNEIKMQQLLSPFLGSYGKYYMHNGSTLGSDSCICILPNLNLTITLLCNFRNKKLLLSDVLLNIIDGVSQSQLKPNSPLELPGSGLNFPSFYKLSD